MDAEFHLTEHSDRGQRGEKGGRGAAHEEGLNQHNRQKNTSGVRVFELYEQ